MTDAVRDAARAGPAAAGPARAGQRPLLELRHVSTHYGLISVLRDVDIQIHAGEIVCLLGGNASGKSTTLRTILGMVTPSQGEVVYDGERISGLPTTRIVRRGLTMVPENRRLFARMTVRENLELGGHLRRDGAEARQDLDRVLALFPVLRTRLGQKAGTLSGGEQQMVAMGRALMAKPKLILMDEPSMGLAPVLVDQVFDIIRDISRAGTTIFVVEQNATMALSIADRGYVLQTGRVVLHDSAAALLQNPLMREAYLGDLT
jgi:branched-chain amino acid transport system ATP-binding protein